MIGRTRSSVKADSPPRLAHPVRRDASHDTLSGEMKLLDRAARQTPGVAVLLAVAIVGFCLVAGALDAGAGGSCPGADGSPRFCGPSGLAGHALVAVAPEVPIVAVPEPGSWPLVIAPEPSASPCHLAPAAPRAPPFLAL
jgi:hypothetical protein